jgi:hypothetical protein
MFILPSNLSSGRSARLLACPVGYFGSSEEFDEEALITLHPMADDRLGHDRFATPTLSKFTKK